MSTTATPTVQQELIAAGGTVLASIVKALAPTLQSKAPAIGAWAAARLGVTADAASVAALTSLAQAAITAAGTVAAAELTKI